MSRYSREYFVRVKTEGLELNLVGIRLFPVTGNIGLSRHNFNFFYTLKTFLIKSPQCQAWVRAPISLHEKNLINRPDCWKVFNIHVNVRVYYDVHR